MASSRCGERVRDRHPPGFGPPPGPGAASGIPGRWPPAEKKADCHPIDQLMADLFLTELLGAEEDERRRGAESSSGRLGTPGLSQAPGEFLGWADDLDSAPQERERHGQWTRRVIDPGAGMGSIHRYRPDHLWTLTARASLHHHRASAQKKTGPFRTRSS